MSARFKAGDRVRVRVGSPPGHFRTPAYVQDKIGAVERFHGDYRNPESLAYGGDGLPRRPLYLVRFPQSQLWPKYTGPARDQLLMDIFEHWLEPA
ncbi:MAG: nitrile hydratase subunit beta [Candidatus Rokubacteria bacterium]|nr:nitrile hydratase subunit beta [Candidatus Rokubacteria bacterium]